MAKTPIFAALPLILLLTMTAAAQAAAQTDSRAYGHFGVSSSAQSRHHAQRSTRPIMPHLPAHSRDDVEDPLAYMHFE